MPALQATHPVTDLHAQTSCDRASAFQTWGLHPEPPDWTRSAALEPCRRWLCSAKLAPRPVGKRVQGCIGSGFCLQTVHLQPFFSGVGALSGWWTHYAVRSSMLHLQPCCCDLPMKWSCWCGDGTHRSPLPTRRIVLDPHYISLLVSKTKSFAGYSRPRLS